MTPNKLAKTIKLRLKYITFSTIWAAILVVFLNLIAPRSNLLYLDASVATACAFSLLLATRELQKITHVNLAIAGILSVIVAVMIYRYALDNERQLAYQVLHLVLPMTQISLPVSLPSAETILHEMSVFIAEYIGICSVGVAAEIYAFIVVSLPIITINTQPKQAA